MPPRKQWVFSPDTGGVKIPEAVQRDVQKRLEEEASGAVYSFSQPIQMRMQELMEGGARSDIAIKLFGDDLNTLQQKADQNGECTA